jgi:hypothetical protein
VSSALVETDDATRCIMQLRCDAKEALLLSNYVTVSHSVKAPCCSGTTSARLFRRFPGE